MGSKFEQAYNLHPNHWPCRYFALTIEESWDDEFERCFSAHYRDKKVQECYGWFVRTLLILGLHGENLRV